MIFHYIWLLLFICLFKKCNRDDGLCSPPVLSHIGCLAGERWPTPGLWRGTEYRLFLWWQFTWNVRENNGRRPNTNISAQFKLLCCSKHGRAHKCSDTSSPLFQTDVHIESKSVFSGIHNQLCVTNAILTDTDVRLQRESLIFIAKSPSFTHLVYK